VPSGFTALLAQPAGEVVGAVSATALAADLGNATLPLRGTIVAADATTTVSVAGQQVPLGVAATQCTGTATHAAFWILNLTASFQKRQDGPHHQYPAMPEVPGGELAVSSNEMFDLPDFPRRLVVVGGGYIACEMASIFRGLGAEVTQLVRASRLLRGFDDDIAAFLAVEMGKKGVDIRLGMHLQHVEPDGTRLRVALHDGQVLTADTVLYATGRVANTHGLGLEEVGVTLGPRGQIVVDDGYHSSVPSILAVGDVTDRMQLTPVALAEAMVVVDRLFGKGQRQMDYEFIPTAVFTHPNIGTVGWTQREARERLPAVRTYQSEFRSLKHTLSGSSERTLMKLVVDDASDRVVGLHMVGAEAGETVQGFAVAMKAGATKAHFDATLGIHPTVAEEFVTMREPQKR